MNSPEAVAFGVAVSVPGEITIDGSTAFLCHFEGSVINGVFSPGISHHD